MGDGGGCHPRDNIALSWLARKLDLSYDWFENVMLCREAQTEWLASLITEQHGKHGYAHRTVGIYGKSFKVGTNLTVGSPATLLANILAEYGFEVRMYDPYVDSGPCPFDWPGVYFIATNHKQFAEETWRFPPSSVVIDPWRFVPAQDGAEVIHVGVGREHAATALNVARDGMPAHVNGARHDAVESTHDVLAKVGSKNGDARTHESVVLGDRV
jgi:UDPglucose 6-dehydrogenase